MQFKLVVAFALCTFVTEATEEANTNATTPKPGTPLYYSLFRYKCPEDFLRLGNGCYFFSKAMADWRSAHFECRAKDSQLAMLDSPWEDRVIKRHLNRPAMTRLNRWIGGIYDWSQDAWVWGSSGDAMKYEGFLARHSSPYSPRWKCVYMAPSLYFRWNYTKCTQIMHFICESPFIRVARG